MQSAVINLLVRHATDELHLVSLELAAKDPSRRLSEPFTDPGVTALDQVDLPPRSGICPRQASSVRHRGISSPLSIELFRGLYRAPTRAQKLRHVVCNPA